MVALNFKSLRDDLIGFSCKWQLMQRLISCFYFLSRSS